MHAFRALRYVPKPILLTFVSVGSFMHVRYTHMVLRHVFGRARPLGLVSTLGQKPPNSETCHLSSCSLALCGLFYQCRETLKSVQISVP